MPASIVQKGEVPNELVGRHYANFTRQERNDIQTYRKIKKLCLSCGTDKHPGDRCSRFSSYANSHAALPGAHALTHSPKRPVSIRNAEPKTHKIAIAKDDEVPYQLVGRAYRDMTKNQRDEIYRFRKTHKLCTFCGSKEHQKLKCQQRENKIAGTIRYKDAQIKSGCLVLIRELTGPFAKLPAELRQKIFEEALEEKKPIEEAVDVFFKVNTFKINSDKALEAFISMIKFFNVANKVRALYFSSFRNFSRKRNEDGTSDHNRAFDLMKLCTNLVKVKLTIRADHVCRCVNYDDFYNIPQEPQHLIDRYEFNKIFELEKLKAISFDGVDEAYLADEARGDSMQGLCDFVKWLDAEYKIRKMNVYTDWTVRGESSGGLWIYKPDAKWEEF